MDVEADTRPPLGFPDPHKQAAAAATDEVLTPAMRMVVVSWMVEVAEEFRLQQETFHHAVGLLDRFLCSTQVHMTAPGALSFDRLACVCTLAIILQHNAVATLTS